MKKLIKKLFKKKPILVETNIEVIKKDFNVDEFNDWFNNECDVYDGRKGCSGIFLRLDKLDSHFVHEYLKHINSDTSYNNQIRCKELIRSDWRNKICNK